MLTENKNRMYSYINSLIWWYNKEKDIIFVCLFVYMFSFSFGTEVPLVLEVWPFRDFSISIIFFYPQGFVGLLYSSAEKNYTSWNYFFFLWYKTGSSFSII